MKINELSNILTESAEMEDQNEGMELVFTGRINSKTGELQTSLIYPPSTWRKVVHLFDNLYLCFDTHPLNGVIYLGEWHPIA